MVIVTVIRHVIFSYSPVQIALRRRARLRVFPLKKNAAMSVKDLVFKGRLLLFRMMIIGFRTFFPSACFAAATPAFIASMGRMAFRLLSATFQSSANMMSQIEASVLVKFETVGVLIEQSEGWKLAINGGRCTNSTDPTRRRKQRTW